MSARHQAEKAALLEQKEVWDQEYEVRQTIALMVQQEKQQRIQTHNAQQTQAIQKQNQLGENHITSVLRHRMVEGPRKTRIRQGWSIFVEDTTKAKELVGGKVVESA